MPVQAPHAVVLIRPHRFTPNPETAADNAFQVAAHGDPVALAEAAYQEVTRAAEVLEAAGITVHLFDDEDATRPDSVFPNNWFSTHAGGRVALYPMYAASRRTERRPDIIEMLKEQYRVQDVIDYSGLEYDDIFLEGTGAMVLDHVSRIAYAARSRRADPVVLERFCTAFGYEPMAFDAADADGTPIYHTNVLMCIAADFVLIGLDMITDPHRRQVVAQRLSGRRGTRPVINLSPRQIHDFAGNAIELEGHDGERFLALSTRAAATLTAEQRAIIERTCTLLPLDVPTIELAGGSVRCMVAGIHLDARLPLPEGVGPAGLEPTTTAV
ncbi:arginine deiminase-related protein [Ornithinimicrobium sp. F0845]|uniref:citrulline utilization hydrolase CtlX n=1 Tax=Ornithinimicrobium sp. F0845 TaxID=2926412 RepID=UPI001FF5CACF|nr:arginine deiminase-related protein [Ornithinimicrobium sp. F0845]MCK0114111.1 arginine deiminase-related protein [Ornithinimicrobium sp. F0845]